MNPSLRERRAAALGLVAARRVALADMVAGPARAAIADDTDEYVRRAYELLWLAGPALLP